MSGADPTVALGPSVAWRELVYGLAVEEDDRYAKTLEAEDFGVPDVINAIEWCKQQGVTDLTIVSHSDEVDELLRRDVDDVVEVDDDRPRSLYGAGFAVDDDFPRDTVLVANLNLVTIDGRALRSGTAVVLQREADATDADTDKEVIHA